MKTIVFLCVENSCRSQMAEAFGKIIGSKRYQFLSAGSKPSGNVNPKAIR
jgi:protein-tyrosine-phosphatase